MGKTPSSNTQVIQQAPVPEPAPPVTQTASEVVQAGMDLRRQEMMKKNIRSTVKAGDTGGFKPMTNPLKGAPNGMPNGATGQKGF
jgi:hypothetical protein